MTKYKQIPIPMQVSKGFDLEDNTRYVKAFRKGGIHILSMQNFIPKLGWLKHISISCEYRYPTWEEMMDAKEYFFGDINCMMIMPKK